MANFEAFRRVISSSINLLFLKSVEVKVLITKVSRDVFKIDHLISTFFDTFGGLISATGNRVR